MRTGGIFLKNLVRRFKAAESCSRSSSASWRAHVRTGMSSRLSPTDPRSYSAVPLKVADLQPQVSTELLRIMEYRLSAIEHRNAYLQGILNQNKAKALKVLCAKLYEMERCRIQSSRSKLRSEQIGSGDRSEHIRTYNFPQGRVTDHIIGIIYHSISDVLQGENLDYFIDAPTVASRNGRNCILHLC